MVFKYEAELRDKAGEFKEVLAKRNIYTEINMVRDYMIKLAIARGEVEYGNLVIYYRAKDGSFSLKTHELKNKAIEPEVMASWERRDSINEPLGGGETGGKCDFENKVAESIIDNNGDRVKDKYKIYVDGSYMQGKVGYGFVVLKNARKVKEESGQIDDPFYLNSRQVGGEIKAVERAVEWASDHGINTIYIYHDFENLEKWVSGEYRTKNDLTKNYRHFLEETGLDIKWVKVDSHTGNKWNDYADQLARKGAGENNTGGDNRYQELKEMVNEFKESLNKQGFSAQIKDINNERYASARLKLKADEDLGYIYIYNTKKHHLITRYHQLKDSSYREELEKIWQGIKGQDL